MPETRSIDAEWGEDEVIFDLHQPVPKIKLPIFHNGLKKLVHYSEESLLIHNLEKHFNGIISWEVKSDRGLIRNVMYVDNGKMSNSSGPSWVQYFPDRQENKLFKAVWIENRDASKTTWKIIQLVHDESFYVYNSTKSNAWLSFEFYLNEDLKPVMMDIKHGTEPFNGSLMENIAELLSSVTYDV